MSHVHNPPRWLESSELPPELERELSAYASEAPSVVRRARMLENLEHQLGLADVSAAEPPAGVARPALGGATGAGAGSVAGTLLKFKLVLGLMATAGAALGAWALWSSTQSQDQRSAPGVHASAPVTAAAFRAVEPQVTRWATVAPELETGPGAVPVDRPAKLAPALSARRERKARSSVAPSLPQDVVEQVVEPTVESAAGVTSGPVSELTLLARARRSLLSSPERSLELAEQHAREFPTGTLCEEREVLAIEALLKLGRVERAKQRALAFERSFPSSAHRAHLARLIARPTR